MTEGGSWLELHEPHAEALSAVCLRHFVSWWRETTDVVVLNSPWLKRSTGIGLRCVFIGLNVVSWFTLLLLDDDAFQKLRQSPAIQLELILTLLCFMHVLWVSMIGRDIFWTGVLLCIGLLLCIHADMMTMMIHYHFGDLDMWGVYLLVTVCHCNVHPAAIWLVFGALMTWSSMLSHVRVHYSWDLFRYIYQFLLLCAFTMDFTNRIKAVVTGALCGSDSTDASESPVAGRTARTPCWLAGFSSWIGWIIYMWSPYINNLRIACASTCLCLLMFSMIAYCWRNLDGCRADVALALLCQTPPVLLSIDVIYVYAVGRNPFPVIDLDGQMLCGIAHILALQALIQAGCQPTVCAIFAIPLWLNVIEQIFILSSVTTLIREFSSVRLHILVAPLVGLVLLCSHWRDYDARMRAIEKGLTSSEENARARERIARSVLEPLGLPTPFRTRNASRMPLSHLSHVCIAQEKAWTYLRMPEVGVSFSSSPQTAASMDAFRNPGGVACSPASSEAAWASPEKKLAAGISP